MKKIILPGILFLVVVLFLPPKADAQTKEECEKTRDRASYNCLLEFGKCYSPCVAKTKDNTGCRDSCKQVENACDKQVDADYKTCLEAIKKDSENPSETNSSFEVQTNTDCHGIFTKESNSCLKANTKCLSSCVDKANAAMSLTVDGGKVMQECTRSVCDPASKACNDKAMANFRSCQDARKTDNQPKTTKVQKQESKWLEFLGINPYQTWLRLQEIAEVTEFYASGELEESLEGGFLNLFGKKSIRQKDEEAIVAKEKTFETIFGKDWREQLNKPGIDVKTEEEAWAIPVSKEEPVVNVPGASDIKRYSWDENSGVVVKSGDWEKIKFKEPSQTGSQTEHMLELEQGVVEVKVRNNNPAQNQFGVDAGWLGVTVSRTHFYVYRNPDGKSAAVIVYEGEVQVKTMGGKTIKVVPENGEPGVVVVSKKLSPVKLAIGGILLIIVIGGVVFILRKKIGSKVVGKKKR